MQTNQVRNWLFYVSFRTTDGRAVAEYRAPAEVTAVASAHGGKAVALASQDGCLTVLNIVDPHE